MSNLSTVHVRFVVDRMAPGQVFLCALQFFPVIVILVGVTIAV